MVMKKGPQPPEVQTILDLAVACGAGCELGRAPYALDHALGHVRVCVPFSGAEAERNLHLFLGSLPPGVTHHTRPPCYGIHTSWVDVVVPDPRPRKYPPKGERKPRTEEGALRAGTTPGEWSILADLLTDKGAPEEEIARALATSEVIRLLTLGEGMERKARGYDVTIAYRRHKARLRRMPSILDVAFFDLVPPGPFLPVFIGGISLSNGILPIADRIRDKATSFCRGALGIHPRSREHYPGLIADLAKGPVQ
jgi:hypothetical protein